jgi:hemoglobin-like flavoprotein
MLLESHTRLVQASYRKIAGNTFELSGIFYRKLFEKDPRLRFLFPEDLGSVQDHLLQMIATAVRQIERFEEVRHHLENLGARHAAYGVVPKDYETFMAAVMDTLSEQLDPQRDQELLQAWEAFFTLVSATMQEGGRNAPARC